MVKFDKKNSQVNNLVDKYNKKALISLPPNSSTLLFTLTFKPPIAVLSFNLITRSDDTNVKQLTEMIHSLALFVRIIQMHLG